MYNNILFQVSSKPVRPTVTEMSKNKLTLAIFAFLISISVNLS